jgi:fused signal recognition particle receptor
VEPFALDTLVAVTASVVAVAAALVVGRRRRGGGSGPTESTEPAEAGGAAAGPGSAPAADAPQADVAPVVDAPPADVAPSVRTGLAGRLARTRAVVGGALADLVGAGLDDAAWEALGEALIAADVGVEAAADLVAGTRREARARGARDVAAVRGVLHDALVAELTGPDRSLARRAEGPTVWLVTGVNGSGKTTTVGKLAAREAAAGRRVVLAAADTFRAAAADQLGIWADRTGAQLVRGAEGADPASVAYAGAEAAAAAGADLLIVDTAGRLQNRRELMDELGKVARVLSGRAGGVDETLLVLDGTVGQNAVAQAEAFTAAVGVTGLVLTKLDGSSRGGIVVAVQRRLGLPVKLVGVGEGVEDLMDFDPEAFVAGLLAG